MHSNVRTLLAFACAGLFAQCNRSFDNPADPANNGGFYGGVDPALRGFWSLVAGTAIGSAGIDSFLVAEERSVLLGGASLGGEGSKANAHEGQIFFYSPGAKDAVYLYDYALSAVGDTLYLYPELTSAFVNPTAVADGRKVMTLMREGTWQPIDTQIVQPSAGTAFVEAAIRGPWDRLFGDGSTADDFLVAGDKTIRYGSGLLDSVSGPAVLIARDGQIRYTQHFGAAGDVSAYLFDYTVGPDTGRGYDTLYLASDDSSVWSRPNASTDGVVVLLKGCPVELPLAGVWDLHRTDGPVRSYFVATCSGIVAGTDRLSGAASDSAVHADSGRIYTINGLDTAFRYDYLLEGNVCYLVADTTALRTDPAFGMPGTMILYRADLLIEPDLWGIWDEVNLADSTTVTDSFMVVTPSSILTEYGTWEPLCSRGTVAADGQIYCDYGSPTYHYDYARTPEGDTLWINRDIDAGFTTPSREDHRYCLVRRTD